MSEKTDGEVGPAKMARSVLRCLAFTAKNASVMCLHMQARKDSRKRPIETSRQYGYVQANSPPVHVPDAADEVMRDRVRACEVDATESTPTAGSRQQRRCQVLK